MTHINTQYFKEYRQELGFRNQQDAKKFFAAKDITPTVDYNYIELLNNRLFEIVVKLNHLSEKSIEIENLDTFCSKNITAVYSKLKKHHII